jgi:ABC-type transport system involved in cytochrome c biogenesis permease subunit
MLEKFAHSNLYFKITLTLYVLSAILFAIRPLSKLSKFVMFAGLLFNVAWIINRWLVYGWAPFRTMYETLVLLCACMIFFSLVVQVVYKIGLAGLFCSIGGVLILIYALLNQQESVKPLPPVLQSFWFVPHVLIYFIAYGCFAVSFFVSILYLAGHRRVYEEHVYKLILFGFVMLSAGMVTGAIWAKQAWGSYWSWDLKENWALITWFVYLLYLHIRYIPERPGKVSVIFAIIGFLAIAFTYVGISVLPSAKESLHIYTH